MGITTMLLSKWMNYGRLNVDEHKCVSAKSNRTECQMCVTTCPVNAISVEQGKVSVNHQSCVECMYCTNTCPQGVFEDEKLTDPLGKIEMHDPVVFTCSKRNQIQGAIPFPCLAELDVSILLYASLSANQVIISFQKSVCKNCPSMSDELQGYLLAITEGTNRLQQKQVIEMRESLNIDITQKSITRRELFAKTYEKITSSMILPLLPKENNIKTVRDKISLSQKKQLLFYGLQNKKVGADKNVPLGTCTGKILVNDDCNGCQVCSRICPTGSITCNSDPALQQVLLEQNISLCTGCKICEYACPQKAIIVETENIRVEDFIQNQWIKVKQVTKEQCQHSHEHISTSEFFL